MAVGDAGVWIDLPGVALVLGALGVLVTTVTTAVLAILTFRRAGQIHGEVRTMNETTIGQNSANRLTDQIEEKPHDERTAQEQRHLDAAPPREPGQGPPR